MESIISFNVLDYVDPSLENLPFKRELNQFQNWIFSSYEAFGRGDKMEGIQFLQKPAVRGFYINNSNLGYKLSFWSFLIYDLQLKLLAKDYILSYSQREKVKSIHFDSRYSLFLKPSIKNRIQPPYQQLYGNIFLELFEKQEILTGFKLHSNIYQDSFYSDPIPLNQMMQDLFFENL